LKTVLRKYDYRGSKILTQKPETPYTNNLFSNHFLEERLKNLEKWKQAEIEGEYEKIQETDQEINEIAYELYDLTEEEIEMVGESVES